MARTEEQLVIQTLVEDTISKEMRRMGINVEQFSRKANKSLKKTLKAFKAMAASARLAKKAVASLNPGIAGLVTLLIGLGAIITATRNSIEFSKAMAEVSTIVDTTTVSMEKLRQGVLDLAEAHGQNERVVAKGLYQSISAGVEAGADSLRFLEEASRLAIAGVAETSQAVDVLTTVLNAYGMGVEGVTRASDVLFKTVEKGKTTLPELAQSMGNAIPLAAALGIEIEEVAAAMATLTKGGIDTRATAIQMRQILVSLLKPTQEAAEIFEREKIALDRASVSAKGFAGVLAEIKEKIPERDLPKLFENVRALTPMFALVGNQADEFARILEALMHASGATATAFDKQMADPAMRASIAFNAMRLAALELGDRIVLSFNEAIDRAGGLERVTNNLKLVFAGMGEAVGGLVVKFGDLSAFASKLVDNLGGFEAVRDLIVDFARTVSAAVGVVLQVIAELAQGLLGLILKIPDVFAVAIDKISFTLLGIKSPIEQLKDAANEAAHEAIRLHRAGAELGKDDALDAAVARTKALSIEYRRLRALADEGFGVEGFIERTGLEFRPEDIEKAFSEFQAQFDKLLRRIDNAAKGAARETKIPIQVLPVIALGRGVAAAAMLGKQVADNIEMLAAAMPVPEVKVPIALEDVVLTTDEARDLFSKMEGELARLTKTADEQLVIAFRAARSEIVAMRAELTTEEVDKLIAKLEELNRARVGALEDQRFVRTQRMFNDALEGTLDGLEKELFALDRREMQLIRTAEEAARENRIEQDALRAIVDLIEKATNADRRRARQAEKTRREREREQFGRLLFPDQGSGAVQQAQEGFVESARGVGLAVSEAAGPVAGMNAALMNYTETIQSAEAFTVGFSAALKDLSADAFNNFAFGVALANTAVQSFSRNGGDALFDFISGTKSAEDAFREFAAQVVADIGRMVTRMLVMRTIMSTIGFFTGGASFFAEGGMIPGGLKNKPMPIKGYSGGGMVMDRPHVAVMAEGGTPEAVVPAPSGEIPVRIQDRRRHAAPTQQVTVNLQVTSLDPRGAAQVILEPTTWRQIENQLASSVSKGSNRNLETTIRRRR